MSKLEVKVDFDTARLHNAMVAAGKRAPIAIARAINHTGAKARTLMIRELTNQTGLKRKVIVKALKTSKAAQQGGLTYTIRSAGGNVRLKFFGARETRAGVSAAPWNSRRVYGGTFMKGGRFPKRVGLSMGGQVFRRVGGGRLPIQGVKSGLFIPTEMVRGASANAFYTVVNRDLPGRLSHELARLFG